jgi:hypothetical protein
MNKAILTGGLMLAAAFGVPAAGQKPPEMTPEIFAPGVVSGEGIQTKLTISADGSTLLYAERDPATNAMIFILRRRAGNSWSDRVVLPFSREFMNMEPSLAPDGDRIVFVSNRPRSGQGEPEKMPDVWLAERAGDDWVKPVRLGPPICADDAADIEAHPCFGPDSSLYFIRQSGQSRRLFHAARRGGGFDEPRALSLVEDLLAGQFSGPCLSADGRALVMHSRKEGGAGGWDLYVSFRDEAGNWSAFVNLGPSVNTARAEADAFFSFDGRSLFFTRDGDIYRVSAEVVEKLRPAGGGLSASETEKTKRRITLGEASAIK